MLRFYGQLHGPQGPLPPLEGSEVWALGLYRVYKGPLRDHVTTPRELGFRF